MIKYKSITVKQPMKSKVVCNKCGKEYNAETDNLAFWDWDEIHSFSISFGYGSHHDLECWKFELCEKCIEELVGLFKIKVNKAEIDPFNEELSVRLC
jgi:protein-arginine kinase activator protein McsA